ncbi:MAG TPA: DUF3078 domain-containing protein [Chitinophagales bacterium]|nr:DUF3078 domain-containing protein [Chitinophagales bacterium]
MKKLLFVLLSFLMFNVNATELPDVAEAKSKEDAKKLAENPSGWKIGGTGSITFNQVGLKNWAAGGDPSISLLGVVNAYADYKYGKHLWQNRLGVEYGTQKIKSEPIRKNSDRLEVFSKYGYAVSKKWYVSAYGNVRTQMTPTYEYDGDGNKTMTISKFANPMVIDGAIGMDFVPNQYLSLFLSPLATKMIIVSDDKIAVQDRHGNMGNNFRAEIGASVILAYKQEVVKNVNVQSVLRVFKDYQHGPAQNIDVDWQNTIGLKVNKFLSAAVFTHLIWDYDQLIPQFDKQAVQTGVARKVQFRNVIGIGLAYTMEKVYDKPEPIEK